MFEKLSLNVISKQSRNPLHFTFFLIKVNKALSKAFLALLLISVAGVLKSFLIGIYRILDANISPGRGPILMTFFAFELQLYSGLILIVVTYF